ncbi:nitrogen permease regulator 2 [Hesseltinella vesiculosa]|uniref:Nitrogen permease regulator 2 n=1 Tax=Hesseltinella vesiculosa TaxID=101127 RepID=A0A1X2GVL5_9FUNG|nr:nitrogen permease regulator 2 [Hesseltinella vesiculosa]
MEIQGFPRIHSIFYAVFDVVKGTVVKYQVPEDSITSYQASQQPLFDFEAISEYVIPKDQLYNRLVTINTGNYKVMGCPVMLHDHEKYGNVRNEFRFNLCFVFDQFAETSSYEAVVRKLSRVLQGLEVECDFLSKEDVTSDKSVQTVMEQLYEDLNSYCECQIPINTFNTINLKLFPTYPNPPAVYDYQVPITTVDIGKMMTMDWDITVQKVAKYVNGIHHVRKIADIANVKPEWTRSCMQHLLYYGCIVMIDIFQFSNTYAIKPELTRLLNDKTGLGQECLDYITLPKEPVPPLAKVFALYSGLQYGVTVKDWMEEHQVQSLPIDIRRFVSFGVIKGLIYRVHKYPMLVHAQHQDQQRFPAPEQQPSLINGNTGLPIHPDLFPFLDGLHHYDEICTFLKCSPQELDDHLGFPGPNSPPLQGWSIRFLHR